MNDPDLFTAAQAAAGYAQHTGRFAREVLYVKYRTARRWKNAEQPLPGTIKVISLAIVARPELARELEAIVATLPPLAGDDD